MEVLLGAERCSVSSHRQHRLGTAEAWEGRGRGLQCSPRARQPHLRPAEGGSAGAEAARKEMAMAL